MVRDPPAYRTDERKGRKGRKGREGSRACGRRFATPSPAATPAHLITTLAVTRGGQLCDLSGLCVHPGGYDRSLTRPWAEQSVAFSEQDARGRGGQILPFDLSTALLVPNRVQGRGVNTNRIFPPVLRGGLFISLKRQRARRLSGHRRTRVSLRRGPHRPAVGYRA